MDADFSSEIGQITSEIFGNDATFTTASPVGSFEERVIFDQDYEPTEVSPGIDWSSYRFMIKGKASNLTNVKQNDSVVIDGIEYNIEDKYESKDGWAYMPLSINN